MNPNHWRSPKNLTLNDVITGAFSFTHHSGLFTELRTLSAIHFPWENVDPDPSLGLDMLYQSRSGNKFISPFLYNYVDDEHFFLTNEGYIAISYMISAQYLSKWNHLWELYNTEYSPLDNYTLAENTGREKSGTNEGTSTLSGRNTITKTGTDSETGTVSSTTELEHGKAVTESGSDSSEIEYGKVVTEGGSDTTDVDYGKVSTNSGTDTETLTHGHVITDGGDQTETTTYGKVTTDEGEPSTTNTQQISGFNSADWANKVKDVENQVTDNTQTLSGSDETETDFGKTETHSGNDVTQNAHGLVVTNSGEDSTTNTYGKTTTGSGSDETTNSYGKVTTDSGTDTTDVDEQSSSTRTLNLTDLEVDSSTTTNSGEYSDTEEIQSTKSGTMYRSPAELMSLDRDFWLTDYFSIVFDDVDKLLTLAIYSERDPITKIY